MKLWLYCDGDGRLQGMNPNDMAGNTGWIEAADASALGENPMHASLHDARGIAMYTAHDGVVKKRTQEEMDAEYIEPEARKSESERLDDVEAQVAMHTECIMEMSEVVYA